MLRTFTPQGDEMSFEQQFTPQGDPIAFEHASVGPTGDIIHPDQLHAAPTGDPIPADYAGGITPQGDPISARYTHTPTGDVLPRPGANTASAARRAGTSAPTAGSIDETRNGPAYTPPTSPRTHHPPGAGSSGNAWVWPVVLVVLALLVIVTVVFATAGQDNSEVEHHISKLEYELEYDANSTNQDRALRSLDETLDEAKDSLEFARSSLDDAGYCNNPESAPWNNSVHDIDNLMSDIDDKGRVPAINTHTLQSLIGAVESSLGTAGIDSDAELHAHAMNLIDRANTRIGSIEAQNKSAQARGEEIFAKVQAVKQEAKNLAANSPC